MTNESMQWGLMEADAALSAGPMNQAQTDPEPAPSPDEYLLRALENHISVERGLLTEYRQLAEDTSDPVVKLVMNLVLEDEERHHSLMRRIATQLKDNLLWAQSPDSLPSTVSAVADAKAYEALRRFVASERSGIHELQNFAGRAEGIFGGLPTELLEMMVLDSQKHEHLMKFLFHRIGGALTADRSQ